MKTCIASLFLVFVFASVSNAAILPLPGITSGTIYARYNGENVSTSGANVTTWHNIQPSSFQTTLNATAHTGFSGSITPGLPDLMSNVSEINGLPYLRFTRTSDTVGDALRTGILSVADRSPSADPFTIFHVGRINAVGGLDPELYDGVDSSNRKALLLLSSGSPANRPALFTSAVANAPVSAPVDGNFHIWATVFNGNSSQIWLDGSLIGSGATFNPGSAPWAGFSIGARHTDAAGT